MKSIYTMQLNLKSILKQTLLFCCFFISFNIGNACDGGSITLNSQTTNPDGSVTYNITFTMEFGSGDIAYYGSVFQFISASNTPSVVNFPPTLFQVGGQSEDLTGLTGSAVNSVNDGDWAPYDNLTNVVSYEYNGFGSAAFDDFTHTIDITIMGCVESIFFDSNVNAGNSACQYTASTGVNCSVVPCNANIDNTTVTGATSTGLNTYELDWGSTVSLNTTGTLPPAAGPDPAGFGYAIFDCMPTVALTMPIDDLNFILDGCFVGYSTSALDTDTNDVTSPFVGQTIFLLPITLDDNCTSITTPGCADINLGSDTDSDGCLDTGDLIQITYLPDDPCECGVPTAICGGQYFSTSAQAEADFNNFASNAAQFDFTPDLPAQNGASYQFCYAYTTNATDTEIGFVNAIGANSNFGGGCIFDRVYHVYSADCGTEIGASGTADFGGGNTYPVTPGTTYNLCVDITINDANCANIADTFVWIYGEPVPCGTCADPNCPIGFQPVYIPGGNIYNTCAIVNTPTAMPFTNCYTATADATGFLGFSNQLPATFSCLPGDIDISWELQAVGDCGNIIPNPVTNANGVGSLFNPEYSGLTPNGDYVLCVTYESNFFGCTELEDLCINHYHSDCTTSLVGTADNGFACMNDGIPLNTTINYNFVSSEGAATIGFLVFCDPPVMPMTEAYYNANALDAILETFDPIGNEINAAGNYVDPFSGVVCNDQIYLVPITISQVTGTGFVIDWSCFSTLPPVMVELGVTPTAGATANPMTICEGEASDLTATGGGTYLWSNGLGTNATVTVTPAATTTYMVTVTDDSGNCEDIASVTVTVTPDNFAIGAATPTCDPSATTYTISFSVTNGTAPYTVTGTGAPGTWIGDDWTSGSINVNTAYNIDVEDSALCSSPENLSGAAPVCACPATATMSGDATICADQMATITVDLAGTAPWTINYNTPSGVMNASGILTSPFTFQTNEAGSFSLIDVNDANCMGSVFGGANISLTDLIVVGAESADCLPNQTQYTVTFTVTTGTAPFTATGTGAPGSWVGNTWTSDPIAIATNYNIDVADANNCNIENVSGTPPNCACPATATMSGDATICANQMATITVDLVGTAPWTINYNTPSGVMNASGILTSPFTFQTNEAGSFSLIDVNDANCMGSVFGGANISLTDLIVVGAESADCLPNQTQYTVTFTVTTGTAPFTATGTGAPGSWVGNTWTSDPIAIATNYNIDVADANNCNIENVSGTPPNCACPATATMSGDATICANQMATITVDLVGTAPWTINYNTPSGVMNASGILTSPFTFQTNEAGSFSLIDVNDANCMGSVFGGANISLTDLIVVGAESADCLPNQTQYTVTFTVTTGTAPFTATGTGAPGSWVGNTWTSDPIAIATNYNIDVTDVNNCNIENVSGTPPNCACPATATMSGDATICADQMATITVDLAGTAPWTINYNTLSGVMNASGILTSPFTFQTNEAGSFSLIDVNDANCMGSVFGGANISLTDLVVVGAESADCLPNQTQYTVTFTVTTGTAPFTATGTGAPGSWVGNTWTSDPIAIATNYNIDVADANNCNIENVSGTPPNCACPATATMSGDATICADQMATISVDLAGTAPWTINYNTPSGVMNASGILTSPFTFQTNEAGSFSLIDVNDANCMGSVFGGANISLTDLVVVGAESADCLPNQTQYTVTFTVTTGTAPFTATGTGAPGSWVGNTWTSDPIAIATNYNIDVADANNCNIENVSGTPPNCACPATATMSGDATICADQMATISVDLAGTAPWTINYNTPSGVMNASGILTSPFTFQTNEAGSFSLIDVNDANCMGSVFGGANISLTDLVVVGAESADCLPNQTQYTVTFTVTTGTAPFTATGTGAPGSWVGNTWTSDPIAIATNYNIDVTDVNNCNIDNVSGTPPNCACPATATMSGDATICADQMATITVDLAGTAPWTINYNTPSGVMNASGILTSPFTFQTNEAGSFSLIDVNDANCMGSVFGGANISLTDLVVVGAESADCLPNQTQYTVTFTVTTGTAPFTATGTGAPGSWVGNTWTSDPIAIATNYNIDVADANNCNIENVSGTPPNCACPATATMSGDATICADQMATITVDLAGTAPWTINYNTPSGVMNASGILTSPFTFQTNEAGSFSLIDVNDANCMGSVFGGANISLTDLVVVGAESADCLPNQTQYTVTFTVTTGTAPFTATGTGAPGSWVGNTWTSDPIAIATNYNIDVADANNCNIENVSGTPPNCACPATATMSGDATICADQMATISVDLAGTAPWTINYNTPSGVMNASGILTSPFTFQTNEAGSFSLIDVNDANCMGSVFGGATIALFDNISLSQETTVCLPNQTQYTVSFSAITGLAPYNIVGTGAPGTWNGNDWTSDPIEINTNYDLLINDANNCNLEIITGNPPNCVCPATANISGNATICSDEMATISITLEGNSPWDIVYTDGVNPAVTVLDIATSPYTFDTNVAGTYTLTSVEDANCVGVTNGSATITVNPLLVVGTATPSCEANQTEYTVTFTVTAGTAPYTVTGIAGAPGTWNADVWTSGLIPVETDYNFDVNDANNCNIENIAGLAPDCSCPVTSSISGTTTICENEMATISIDLVGTAPWDIVYSDANNVNQIVNGILTSPYTFDTNIAGIYSVVSVNDALCTGVAAGDATITVETLVPTPVVNCTQVTETTVEFDWTNSGVFDYEVIATIGGVMQPAVTIIGTNYLIDNLLPETEVTISVTAISTSLCPNSGVGEGTCTTLPCPNTIASINNINANYCSTDMAFLIDASPAGGVFTGNGITNGQFDPSAAGTNPITITYTYTNPTTQCVYTAEAMTIVSDPLPTPTVTCMEVGIDFVTFQWSDVGVNDYIVIIDNDGIQIPVTGNTYTVDNLMVNQDVTITVMAVGNSICGDSGIGTETCTSQDCPTVVAAITNLDTQYCGTDAPITLVGDPIGGVFSIDNVDLIGDVFDPSSITGTSATIVYTYILPNTTCVYSSQMTVDILPPFGVPVVTCGTATMNSVTFNWTDIGSAEYMIEITVNGMVQAAIPNTSDLFYTVTALNPSDEVSISVIGVGLAPCSDSMPGVATCFAEDCIPSTAQISGMETICGGESATISFNFTGTGPYNVTYLSNNGNPITLMGLNNGDTETVAPFNTTNYTIQSVEDLGNVNCAVNVSGTATISVNTNITVDVAATSDFAGTDVSCNGEADGEALASNPNGGTAPYSYEWSNGQTGETANNLSAGIYEVTVTDANGCSGINNITLTEPTAISAEIIVQAPLCFEDTNGFITADTTIGGSMPYLYSLNGGPLQSQSIFTNLGAGDYEILVEDVNGCQNTYPTTVNQPEEVTLTLGDNMEINLGDSIRLNAQSNPLFSNLDTIIWSRDTTTLSCIDCPEPWATPFSTTLYSAQIEDANGCTAEDNITIAVKRNVDIYIPTAFTPDNDGINDLLMIYAGPSVKSIKAFQVYDRWGEKMFEHFEFLPNLREYGWNGIYGGSLMNPQVFVYYAEVELVDGTIEFVKGDFTLLK